MRFFFRRVFSLILVFILFLLLTSLWGFYISIRPPRILSSLTPQDLGLNYEDISFTTSDGLNLKGWWIPTENKAAKTVILLHGYPADKGDILPTLAFLRSQYHLFLFDFRYLGRSEGKYSTAGAKETEDLRAAIFFLKSRGISEIGLWGFSMGGAVALMVSPEIPEIKAVIAESSYASLKAMAPELYRLPGLRHLLGFLTGIWTKLFINIDIGAISPVKSVKNIAIPVLIIHSTNDRVIPFSQALALKEALEHNPRAEFWFRENIGHGELGGEYQKRIEEFFEKNL